MRINFEDDVFITEMMIEIAMDNFIYDRFPAEGACLNCFEPILTLDKDVFGGPFGGKVMELITMIGWILEGKETFDIHELRV